MHWTGILFALNIYSHSPRICSEPRIISQINKLLAQYAYENPMT